VKPAGRFAADGGKPFLGLGYAEYSDAEREAVVHAHPRTEHFLVQ